MILKTIDFLYFRYTFVKFFDICLHSRSLNIKILFSCLCIKIGESFVSTVSYESSLQGNLCSRKDLLEYATMPFVSQFNIFSKFFINATLSDALIYLHLPFIEFHY